MWLGGLPGHTTGHHSPWRAAGPYYRAPWWLGVLQGHTTRYRCSWECCRAILQGTVVAGRAAEPYYRAPWWLGGLQGILQGAMVARGLEGFTTGGLKGHTAGHCGDWKGW